MVDSIGGSGSRPVGLGTISSSQTTNTTAAEVPGEVTKQSWAPAGATAHKPAVTGFDDKNAKAPSWLGLAGSAVSAGLRGMIGSLKNVPILGNALNLVDATLDAGKLTGMLLFGKGTPQERAKVATDLVSHTVGIFNKEVGADYDKGQAKMRLSIVGMEAGAKLLGIDIPPELRKWEPVMAAGYGALRGFTPRNPDGSERSLPVSPLGILAVAAGGAFVLPKLQNMLGAGA